MASSSALPSAPPAVPSPGAAGIGDPYFPDLGNGGYDVDHYDLQVTVADPKVNHLDGVTTVSAHATQALSSFDLDLTGLDVASVTVDGAPATATRHDRELVITPSTPIASGASFTTIVTYGGSPEPRASKAIPIAVGWISQGDGSFVLSEPEGGSTFFPVNDHPLDKATYSFHVTVPDGTVAVANGDELDHPSAGGTTTWNWDAKAPMASYLVEVAVGNYVLTPPQTTPDGITIRNAFDARLADRAATTFDKAADMISFFSTVFGPYPFDAYGVLVVNEKTGFELENQTMSLFDTSLVGASDTNPIIAHELAHQWFGDDVSLASWKDIWLNEGFASYAEWLWTEHLGGPSVADSARQAHDRLASDPELAGPPPGDPGVEGMFRPSVYWRGALTLQALRLTIGDDAFFQTLRTYVQHFGGGNATTHDFEVAAARASGRTDLQPLFDAWLLGSDLPPLPG